MHTFIKWAKNAPCTEETMSKCQQKWQQCATKSVFSAKEGFQGFTYIPQVESNGDLPEMRDQGSCTDAGRFGKHCIEALHRGGRSRTNQEGSIRGGLVPSKQFLPNHSIPSNQIGQATEAPFPGEAWFMYLLKEKGEARPRFAGFPETGLQDFRVRVARGPLGGCAAPYSLMCP